MQKFMEISSWTLIAGPYYSDFFEVIIPFIIFIIVEIRSRKLTAKSVTK